MAMYESEHTKFIREWLENNPQEVEQQRKGRALWWDKSPISPDEARRIAAAKVAQKPYYYDAN